MPAFVIARNERTSFYEVHTPHCAHLMSSGLERMVMRSGPSAKETAEQYEAENEGCLTKLGPCARKLSR